MSQMPPTPWCTCHPVVHVSQVRAHEANSHAGFGWQTFTDAVIRVLDRQRSVSQWCPPRGIGSVGRVHHPMKWLSSHHPMMVAGRGRASCSFCDLGAYLGVYLGEYDGGGRERSGLVFILWGKFAQAADLGAYLGVHLGAYLGAYIGQSHPFIRRITEQGEVHLAVEALRDRDGAPVAALGDEVPRLPLLLEGARGDDMEIARRLQGDCTEIMVLLEGARRTVRLNLLCGA